MQPVTYTYGMVTNDQYLIIERNGQLLAVKTTRRGVEAHVIPIVKDAAATVTAAAGNSVTTEG